MTIMATMKTTLLIIATLLTLNNQTAFGWGETGHHMIGRTAARILESNPRIIERLKFGTPASIAAIKEFLSTYSKKEIQQGHVSSIPDTHYRNLDAGLSEDGQLLGDSTHFLDPENLLSITNPEDFFKVKLPLNYEEARQFSLKAKPGFDFFHSFGTAPWRSQQFYSLYANSLAKYPKTCTGIPEDEAPTRTALTYAGLLSHFVGDSSMPYHATNDYDGIKTNQKGIHSYFESELVDNLEHFGLAQEVFEATRALTVEGGTDSVTDFVARSHALYPNQDKSNEVTALVMTLLGDSYQWLNPLRERDQMYAVATLEEALSFDDCKNLPQVKRMKADLEKMTSATEKKLLLSKKVMGETGADGKAVAACRRPANYTVDGKTVAVWFKDMIVKRIAISSALLSDLWARGFLENGLPKLCATYKYALKPSFVSPTDANCFGYALNENPAQFLKKDKTSALPWKNAAASTEKCLSF